MSFHTWLLWLVCCCGLGACTATADNPVEQALSANQPALQTVMRNLSRHGVQILFTEIERGADGSIRFRDYSFGLDDNRYFYPASTVKLPLALLVLEKLQELEAREGINRHSRYRVGTETEVRSIADDLIKLLVVSDDAAYNRLFELLGKDEINRRLQARGLNARITHRLSIADSAALQTRQVTLYRETASPLQVGPIANSPIQLLPLDNLIQGSAYIEDGELIQAPFDFSRKNYLPLRSLHGIIKRLIFPQAFAEQQRFQLDESRRRFILDTISTLPREAGYDEAEYPDGRFKYLLFGDSTERQPEHIDIYNKVGRAYGYLTDSAYIVDHQRQREFLISATIHVNANRTFNDNQYEYMSGFRDM